MFGVYRTILAACVLLGHLSAVPYIATHAVHGFFVLSGYLMTYIMVNTYGYTAKGMYKFACNRFLRLYPAYFFVLLLSVALIVVFDGSIAQYKSAMYLPNTLGGVLENFTMVYFNAFPIKVEPRLSPPTWALTIEICYYLLICLGISRNSRFTLIWLMLGVIYTVYTLYKGYDGGYRYAAILGGALPFSLGAALYHYKDKTVELLGCLPSVISNPWLAISIFFINAIARCYLPGMWWFGFYTNLVIAVYIVAVLSCMPLKGISKALDYKVGEISYHMYLLHWLVAAVVAQTLFGLTAFEVDHRVTLITAGLTVVLSFLITYFVDEPVSKLRARIRKSNK